MFEDSPFPPGPGYWALVRHEDVWAASRNPQLFCSGKGTNIGDLPQEMNEFFGSMINMDDPKHFRLRSIVAKGFTPKEIAHVESYVTTKATEIVDRMLEAHPDGACDFVEEVAAPLPLRIICEMMGIPAPTTSRSSHWTNTSSAPATPSTAAVEALMTAALEMFTYAQALGEDRQANPQDDITSALMAAEVDGERLTSQEFGSFFILLVVAGNETTRNAISHGMRALTDHPDQRKIWFDDFEAHTKTAVEEIVRWATPVIHFRRTATEDTCSPASRSPPATRSCSGTTRPTATRACSPTRTGSTSPGRCNRAGRLRCRRSALLSRRQPGPARDHGDVRRDPPPPARHADHRRTRVPAELLHQRHQAPAVRVVNPQRSAPSSPVAEVAAAEQLVAHGVAEEGWRDGGSSVSPTITVSPS